MTCQKVDLIKLHKAEYIKPKQAALVQIAPARYLAIPGRGPVGEAFGERVGHLYNMAYTIKMTSKKDGLDYRVCPLEARYWCAKKKEPYAFVGDDPSDQSKWLWQVMIRTPSEIGNVEMEAALQTMLGKGKPEALREVELIDLEEGECAQVLHMGPFSESQRSIDLLLELAAAEGKSAAGRHHEIYLSDPRRVPEEMLKTTLRLPVR